jgi:hypothetical protein
VSIDAHTGYGLGWYIEDYNGMKVIYHVGGTVGFASELVVIPEREVGFVLLTNRLDMVAPIGRMATYRLLEMMTGSEQVYDRETRQTVREIQRQIFTLSLITRKKVNHDHIAPYLGTYYNDVLGQVELVQHHDNTLSVDFGEYQSDIRRLALEENKFIFYESVFIGKTITLSKRTDGTPTMMWPGDEDEYTFVQSEQVIQSSQP